MLVPDPLEARVVGVHHRRVSGSPPIFAWRGRARRSPLAGMAPDLPEELMEAYADAWAAWERDEAELWEVTAGDGLA